MLDKLFDPNTPDLEYKPTMKKLLEGDLDSDKQSMVVNIINCKDEEQKPKMIKRFLNSFRKEPEIETVEAPKKKKAPEVEEEPGLVEGDWKILVKRMIDDKTPV